MQNLRLRVLSYLIIAYMLLAFAWWAILLFTKNKDAFYAKAELLKIGMIAEQLIDSEDAFLRSAPYQELRGEYKRQEWMIFGEAAVFVISLVIGVWLINRGYNKEINSAEQRRNFLLSITHELKSPIASIQLVLETIIKRQLPKVQVDQLSTNALKDNERLNTLVNNLLLAAKVENAYHPVFEDIDFKALIEEISTKLKSKYPKVNFEIQTESDIPIVHGDRMGLTSVVLNLMENGIKYSTENPSIGVKLFQRKEKIHLEVADQGVGIADKEKKKIFEKFYRVGNEDIRRTKGTGLGLYIVNEIVKAHLGKITVKDNRPSGSIFSITLPINKMKV
ncbi:MAG: sensor histidine kinase [Saprospiraceae bacterium]